MLSSVQLPPPVRPGQPVGVAALSGPVDPQRLQRGLAALADLGFEPRLADNLHHRRGYLAGSDGERLDAFHRLAADPSLGAILFARGGYGVMRLLPAVDWPLLARYPRAYVGYSDLTAFLLQVPHRLGLASFHGPMVAADLARGLSPEEEGSLLAALAGELPAELPAGRWLRAGEAEGPVVGGCLSLLAALVGTPFFPSLEGAILVVEDVGERLYRLDRLLTQLLLAGSLDGLAALVVGHVDLLPDEDGDALPDLLAERAEGFSWPVAVGLPCGHSAPNLTLPLGLPGHLGADGSLRIGVS